VDWDWTRVVFDHVKINIVVYFRVLDIEAAARRVRELGGEADDLGPEGEGGRFVSCRDDQGVQFGLHEPKPRS